MTNNNCDGSGPCKEGEVRVLPTGEQSNAILCARCFRRELSWRKGRNGELEESVRFDLPTWDSLKVYGAA